jgi:acyl-homoserine lactone synthase
MIHVVSAANRHLYEDDIERMFRIRHDIFVGERGWTDLARPDGRDVDAYDDIDAVYCLAMEGDRIVGGHRLYPTTRPNMLGTAFPHLAAVRGVPEDPAVWEWSRYFVVRDRRDGGLNLMLMAAVQELCLDEGITEVSAVMETWWLPRFQQSGFTVRPLGLPALVNDEWTMAACIEISPATLDFVRERAGLRGPVLVRVGPQRPLIDRALVRYRMAMGAGV